MECKGKESRQSRWRRQGKIGHQCGVSNVWGKPVNHTFFFAMLPTPYVNTVCSFIFANTLITALDRTIRDFTFSPFSLIRAVMGVCTTWWIGRRWGTESLSYHWWGGGLKSLANEFYDICERWTVLIVDDFQFPVIRLFDMPISVSFSLWEWVTSFIQNCEHQIIYFQGMLQSTSPTISWMKVYHRVDHTQILKQREEWVLIRIDIG